jgi:hypothetical protein
LGTRSQSVRIALEQYKNQVKEGAEGARVEQAELLSARNFNL